MTREEQVTFTRELLDNVGKGLLDKIENIPADWDGVELRQWIADEFQGAVYKRLMTRQRLRAYNNAVITEYL